MHKYADNKYIHARPNNVAVHGSSEPVLTVLDVRGFPVRDLFVMGFNPDCGSLVVDTKHRALQAQAALEPAYKTVVRPFEGSGDWEVKYDRRNLDGSEPGRFVTEIALKDGTVVMRDGRWTH